MVRLVFKQADGSAVEVQARPGISVMEAAVQSGVEGIIGECGGSLSCATCHVYVDPAWFPLLPGYAPHEEDMLDMAMAPPVAESRLSCQIEVTPELEGLVVMVPPNP